MATNGMDMPQIGYGTWQQRGEAVRGLVARALETGYRHIDTAQAYDNEEMVGRGIADAGLPRGEIWVTTKIFPEDFGPGAIRPAAERSLERLGLDQVDLILAHWPSQQHEIAAYMEQFGEIAEGGLTRHVGVSNFTNAQMDRAAEVLGETPVATNQVECHVFLQNRAVRAHCEERGVRVTAYSPLARGAAAGAETVEEIARAKDATPGQVALAFLMHEGITVIPTTSKEARVVENFGARDVSLDDEDMSRLRGLDEGRRLIDPSFAPDWD